MEDDDEVAAGCSPPSKSWAGISAEVVDGDEGVVLGGIYPSDTRMVVV